MFVVLTIVILYKNTSKKVFTNNITKKWSNVIFCDRVWHLCNTLPPPPGSSQVASVSSQVSMYIYTGSLPPAPVPPGNLFLQKSARYPPPPYVWHLCNSGISATVASVQQTSVPLVQHTYAHIFMLYNKGLSTGLSSLGLDFFLGVRYPRAFIYIYTPPNLNVVHKTLAM